MAFFRVARGVAVHAGMVPVDGLVTGAVMDVLLTIPLFCVLLPPSEEVEEMDVVAVVVVVEMVGDCCHHWRRRTKRLSWFSITSKPKQADTNNNYFVDFLAHSW